MNNTEIHNSLTAAIRELEKIEVKGQANLASLLGTINFLSQLANKLVEEPEPEAAE